MLKTIALVLTALVVALAGGAASAWYMLERAESLGGISIGRWSAQPEAGSEAADPYTRARSARTGNLPLGPAEGLVFTARLDEAGQPLRRQCRYTVTGRMPAARFWTLHATDAGSGRALVGDTHPAAVSSRTLLRQPDGTVQVHVGPQIRPGNWLATSGRGSYRLALSLFDAPLGAGSSLSPLSMPTIVREGPCDA